MSTYIAFLRGINVGGNHRIKMADLRALCEKIDFEEPQTTLQSGNIVFGSSTANSAVLAQQLTTAINATYGYHVEAFVRSAEEFQEIIAAAPLSAAQKADGSKAAIMFTRDDVATAALDALRDTYTDDEVFHAGAKEVYLYYPNGMGRSKLTYKMLESHLDTTGTVRNWNTIERIKALLAERHTD